MGLMDGEIVEVGQSVDTVALNLLCNMIEKKGEESIVTVFYGKTWMSRTQTRFLKP